MNPNELPRNETIAATDELFKEQIVPFEQPRGDGNAAEDDAELRLDEVKKPSSPIQDYVRELRQEYEQQEEEGKL